MGGAFFRFTDGKLLTRDQFVAAVRTALTAAGLLSVRRIQLPYRSGNDSSSQQATGLLDKDPGSVGECSVHGVHSDTTQGVMCSVGELGRECGGHSVDLSWSCTCACRYH